MILAYPRHARSPRSPARSRLGAQSNLRQRNRCRAGWRLLGGARYAQHAAADHHPRRPRPETRRDGAAGGLRLGAVLRRVSERQSSGIRQHCRRCVRAENLQQRHHRHASDRGSGRSASSIIAPGLPASRLPSMPKAKPSRDILELVRRYRRFTHFCHISTQYEIDLLRAAKEEGLPISIGVTPHHLYLTEADLPTLGALGLMKPTLKTAADRDALWQALARGVVDVVESDHAPHTLAEKQSANPPYGVPGLETTLPLLCLAVEARAPHLRSADRRWSPSIRSAFSVCTPTPKPIRWSIPAPITSSTAPICVHTVAGRRSRGCAFPVVWSASGFAACRSTTAKTVWLSRVSGATSRNTE